MFNVERQCRYKVDEHRAGRGNPPDGIPGTQVGFEPV